MSGVGSILKNSKFSQQWADMSHEEDGINNNEHDENQHSLPSPDEMPAARPKGKTGPVTWGDLPAWMRSRDKRLMYLLGLSAVTCLILWIVVIASAVSNGRDSKRREAERPGAPYKCPGEVERAQNDISDYYDPYRANAKIFRENPTRLYEYATEEYDGFGPNSFTQLKAQLYKWKQKHFCEHLKSGDRMYESAMGTGLNLFMTLDILFSACDIDNIHVEGNDYVFDSIRNAEYLYKNVIPGTAKSTQFCGADSLHLEHIPRGSFDLVYTGYMDPIVDAMHLYTSEGSDVRSRIDKLKSYCDSSDKAEDVLTRLDQNAQEKYHSDFVKQMIRIAKPGAPIIIEFVSYPACSLSDWGGVDISFWIEGASKYGWDVDEGTVDIFQLSLNGQRRYNVMLMKNPSSTA
eukprot:CAMPEP_0198285736 /NCGR_PEP_ID=MMETSP1449-20131203/4981_1 /TAXON_ID=420275 /ORGANISM="Attheya septentrionalis, Strain CCMP2084" /LENGTH=403 /DNA_ID=CAMNT_0043983271 /DNA_START=103 /DNA_END=1314 /DNA_ORIENTATION=+